MTFNRPVESGSMAFGLLTAAGVSHVTVACRAANRSALKQASCHVMMEPYTILAQLALAEDPPTI